MLKNRDKYVIAVAGDPGGAKALLPVIKALLSLGVKVELVGYNQAVIVWRKFFISVSEVFSKQDLLGKLNLLQRPSFILLGTSVNDLNLECDAIAWAKDGNIISLSVLDYWSNYQARFLSAQGDLCLPNAIAVMDEHAKNQMLSLGFSCDILHVVGVLSLVGLDDFRLNKEDRFSIKRFLLKNNDCDISPDFIFVFVSQPLSVFYSHKSLISTPPPFDERLVLNDILMALDEYLSPRNLKAKLFVRLHPRELFMPQFNAVPSVDVCLANVFFYGAELSSYDYVQAADVVFGMNSMLLLEGCYLGAKIISYQPSLRASLDSLPSNAQGLSFSAYSFNELSIGIKNTIDSLNNGELHADRHVLSGSSAVENVIGLVDLIGGF